MTILDRRRLMRRLRTVETSQRSPTPRPADGRPPGFLRRGRRVETDDSDLVESLSHVHRLVMSGHSLESAITNAVLTQSSHELSRLYDLMSAGDDVASSSRRIAQSLHDVRNPTPRERDGAIAMHVLSLAASIGGRVADQIGSLVDLLDDRMSVRRERRAQAASAAASMKLLTWLPSVCGIWILLDSASVRTFLIGSITGWTCLVLGVFLNLAGRVWMQRLVASC